MSLPVRIQQSPFGGNRDGLRAVLGAELVEDRRDVELHGPLRDRERSPIWRFDRPAATSRSTPRSRALSTPVRPRGWATSFTSLAAMRGLRYDSPACTCRIACAISAAGDPFSRYPRAPPRIAPNTSSSASCAVNTTMPRPRAAKLVTPSSGVGARELEIEQDDVGLLPRVQSKSFVERVGLPHHFDVGLAREHAGDAVAHDGMVVDDEDPDHFLDRGGAAPLRGFGGAAALRARAAAGTAPSR